jgi:hypothetical protein
MAMSEGKDRQQLISMALTYNQNELELYLISDIWSSQSKAEV